MKISFKYTPPSNLSRPPRNSEAIISENIQSLTIKDNNYDLWEFCQSIFNRVIYKRAPDRLFISDLYEQEKVQKLSQIMSFIATKLSSPNYASSHNQYIASFGKNGREDVNKSPSQSSNYSPESIYSEAEVSFDVLNHIKLREHLFPKLIELENNLGLIADYNIQPYIDNNVGLCDEKAMAFAIAYHHYYPEDLCTGQKGLGLEI